MYAFLGYRVDGFMSRDLVALAEDATLAEAEDRIEAGDFDALPVVARDGRLVGIVSKLDVLRAFAFGADTIVPQYAALRARPVREVMTLQPLTARPEEPLTRVLETLVATRVKSLPVVDDGRVVGMISRQDVIRALRRAADEDARSRAGAPR